MKKVLVIGSTVVDIIINLEASLPKTGEDLHIVKQKMSLGGCAYNVSDMLHHFHIPYLLFSPVGSGLYGDFVKNELTKKNIPIPIPFSSEENGCCYCFIEKSGERTFASYHGAEYHFCKEWFSLLNPDEISCVYICGLEIEEATGIHIIDFLEKNPHLPVFFAPGPRFSLIPKDLLYRIFQRSPLLHLNKSEALAFTQETNLSAAGRKLQALTHNDVIITLGKEGCYYLMNSTEEILPSPSVKQIDTTGAGDSHIGAIIACLQRGASLPSAIRTANQVSACVVKTPGALLDDNTFQKLGCL